MSKIIFEINYDIFPEKREDYLELIGTLRDQIRSSSNKNFSVYENKKGSNNFSEIYLCESEEEYESIDDNQDDSTVELTERLFKEFIKSEKVTYFTKFEI
ncbi:hypothetical protein BH10BAC5_BH10BAC5_04120 [soil metagenome]